jgi:membrane-bound lytic murein transglycosylase D
MTRMMPSVPRIVLAVLVLGSTAVAQTTEFPSQGLENRIDFWKKVYTQYGQDDVIIHDRDHVHLIYDVAVKGEQAPKIAAVKQALEEITANLATPENLSPAAAQIRDAIIAGNVPLSEDSLSQLRGNIHKQLGIKERFRDGIIRSGRYIEAFRQVFEAEGLPSDIALLPLVESSYENRALSHAGAAGIWQFTRGTGRLYLKVTRKADERLDPAKATRAAARLMHDNYRALGAWPLAITAYNHGRGGMMQAQSEVGTADITKIIKEYDGPLFGYASMNFYSEFLAAIDVYKNYEGYFGQLVLDRPTQSFKAPAVTKVAAQTEVKPKPPAAKVAASDKYKVRKGDTLAEIAQRFGVSVRQLMDSNNLRNSVIHAGQILLVK